MRRASIALSVVLIAGLATAGALAQRAPAAFRYDDPAETRAALQRALEQREAAERRSAVLEREADAATAAAEKTARAAAALAARIQQAEAGAAAAEARIRLIARERAILREDLGAEQGPIVRLTAALQQFSRRPAALVVLRPGEVKDIVYTRAILASTVPQVRAQTGYLRARLQRSRILLAEAEEAATVLRAEELRLADRRRELAALESRQRLASRRASGSASREADRALALAEQARDLDSLVGELDRAGELRRRLAALPGPKLRPAQPEDAEVAASETFDAPPASAGAPPRPYVLPVNGRAVIGFGAEAENGTSTGLTLAPRAGAQVVAPADGRVAFAGPYRGYGRIVIIEHEGGWTSLVTGLARTDVAVGQQLVGGSPLGVAGQGGSTVTVELRQDGEPVNPLRFVG